jgi:hypothetical protein
VAPNGNSWTPGLSTLPDTQNRFGPVDLSVPIAAYAGAPMTRTGRTLTSVSTLFSTVGLPKRPFSTGNGGLAQGSPR